MSTPEEPNMNLERAHQIVKAINTMCLRTMEVVDKGAPAWLEEVSLADMLKANEMVKAENRAKDGLPGPQSFSMVADDRLISSVYTILHWPASKEPILLDERTNRCLGVLPLSECRKNRDDDDEDEDE